MLGKVIHNLLSNDATVAGLVGTNIFPGVMPGDKTDSGIAYVIGSNANPQTKEGGSGVTKRAQINISCWGTTYDITQQIAAACKAALDDQSGTIETVNVRRMWFDNEQDATWNEKLNLFETAQDYSLNWR